MPRFDYGALRNTVTKHCSGIDEPTWGAAALTLARYMHWEFENAAR
jgi:hypothetical protein